MKNPQILAGANRQYCAEIRESSCFGFSLIGLDIDLRINNLKRYDTKTLNGQHIHRIYGAFDDLVLYLKKGKYQSEKLLGRASMGRQITIFESL